MLSRTAQSGAGWAVEEVQDRAPPSQMRSWGRDTGGEDVLMYLPRVISLACVSLLTLLRQVHGHDLSAYPFHKG